MNARWFCRGTLLTALAVSSLANAQGGDKTLSFSGGLLSRVSMLTNVHELYEAMGGQVELLFGKKNVQVGFLAGYGAFDAMNETATPLSTTQMSFGLPIRILAGKGNVFVEIVPIYVMNSSTELGSTSAFGLSGGGGLRVHMLGLWWGGTLRYQYLFGGEPEYAVWPMGTIEMEF